MKSVLSAIAVVVLAAVPARAQQTPAQQQHTALPEIIVGAPPPSVNLNHDSGNAGAGRAAPGRAAGEARCGDAAAGQSLDCINARLRKQVDQVNPPVTNTPPIDAKSQDLKVGVVNVPAVQQQYGRNFGVSAFPYRPPAPVYTHR